MKKRDKYLCAAIFNLCWYCIAALILTAHDHAVPDELVDSYKAATNWSTYAVQIRPLS